MKFQKWVVMEYLVERLQRKFMDPIKRAYEDTHDPELERRMARAIGKTPCSLCPHTTREHNEEGCTALVKGGTCSCLMTQEILNSPFI